MASKENGIEWPMKQVEEYCSSKNGMGDTVEDFDEIRKLGHGFSLVVEIKEIDIDDMTIGRPTYINSNLSKEQKEVVHVLLKGFSNCFSWEYTYMPDLSRDLVEHRWPIKQGFIPYKQLAQSFNSDIIVKVKDEVERLLRVGFIQPCRYTEWVSNIVPVEKKGTGKIRACIDFRKLNRATPKDEYLMPIVDVLVNNS
jgi:hypothetical protein